MTRRSAFATDASVCSSVNVTDSSVSCPMLTIGLRTPTSSKRRSGAAGRQARVARGAPLGCGASRVDATGSRGGEIANAISACAAKNRGTTSALLLLGGAARAMSTLTFVTGNAKKLEEVRAILAGGSCR